MIMFYADKLKSYYYHAIPDYKFQLIYFFGIIL